MGNETFYGDGLINRLLNSLFNLVKSNFSNFLKSKTVWNSFFNWITIFLFNDFNEKANLFKLVLIWILENLFFQ